jgi:hypothetical protein
VVVSRDAIMTLLRLVAARDASNSQEVQPQDEFISDLGDVHPGA